MSLSKKIASAMCFDNGAIAVFDAHGHQIPETQEGWPVLWARYAESKGFDPDGVTFRLQNGTSVTISRTELGYNWRVNR